MAGPAKRQRSAASLDDRALFLQGSNGRLSSTESLKIKRMLTSPALVRLSHELMLICSIEDLIERHETFFRISPPSLAALQVVQKGAFVVCVSLTNDHIHHLVSLSTAGQDRFNSEFCDRTIKQFKKFKVNFKKQVYENVTNQSCRNLHKPQTSTSRPSSQPSTPESGVPSSNIPAGIPSPVTNQLPFHMSNMAAPQGATHMHQNHQSHQNHQNNVQARPLMPRPVQYEQQQHIHYQSSYSNAQTTTLMYNHQAIRSTMLNSNALQPLALQGNMSLANNNIQMQLSPNQNIGYIQQSAGIDGTFIIPNTPNMLPYATSNVAPLSEPSEYISKTFLQNEAMSLTNNLKAYLADMDTSIDSLDLPSASNSDCRTTHLKKIRMPARSKPPSPENGVVWLPSNSSTNPPTNTASDVTSQPPAYLPFSTSPPTNAGPSAIAGTSSIVAMPLNMKTNTVCWRPSMVGNGSNVPGGLLVSSNTNGTTVWNTNSTINSPNQPQLNNSFQYASNSTFNSGNIAAVANGANQRFQIVNQPVYQINNGNQTTPQHQMAPVLSNLIRPQSNFNANMVTAQNAQQRVNRAPVTITSNTIIVAGNPTISEQVKKSIVNRVLNNGSQATSTISSNSVANNGSNCPLILIRDSSMPEATPNGNNNNNNNGSVIVNSKQKEPNLAYVPNFAEDMQTMAKTYSLPSSGPSKNKSITPPSSTPSVIVCRSTSVPSTDVVNSSDGHIDIVPNTSATTNASAPPPNSDGDAPSPPLLVSKSKHPKTYESKHQDTPKARSMPLLEDLLNSSPPKSSPPKSSPPKSPPTSLFSRQDACLTIRYATPAPVESTSPSLPVLKIVVDFVGPSGSTSTAEGSGGNAVEPDTDRRQSNPEPKRTKPNPIEDQTQTVEEVPASAAAIETISVPKTTIEEEATVIIMDEDTVEYIPLRDEGFIDHVLSPAVLLEESDGDSDDCFIVDDELETIDICTQVIPTNDEDKTNVSPLKIESVVSLKTGNIKTSPVSSVEKKSKLMGKFVCVVCSDHATLLCKTCVSASYCSRKCESEDEIHIDECVNPDVLHIEDAEWDV